MTPEAPTIERTFRVDVNCLQNWREGGEPEAGERLPRRAAPRQECQREGHLFNASGFLVALLVPEFSLTRGGERLAGNRRDTESDQPRHTLRDE
jgi:hypothetical protein